MFGDKKKLAALILKGASSAPMADDSESDDGLETAMEEFLNSVNSKSASGMAKALRSAFDMLESQPHEESTSEEDKGFTQ